ncbi:MAG: metallophosphatase domain-containing protein [Prevotellaceae bacterium]|jgi:Icc-related predicted phosphoesterase|nr:metallophosphatase domain-containing protein [Prevotellaceae bacterium]
MRILHLSDTHNLHWELQNLPFADVIVHSGDLSMVGTGNEVVDFVEWFGALDYRYKIFIAGNHDYCLEKKNREKIQRFLPENCFYLCNSGVTIDGAKFWGIPFFFSDDVSGEYFNMITQIPMDTDILISHRPPFGILDNANNITFGCPNLLQAVLDVRPRYHLFGHIHDAYGIEKSTYTTFVNAALVNEDYQLLNKPVVVDI